MEILFVHLSDLHLCEYDEYWEIKLDKLLKVIEAQINSAISIFIIVSGDIVNKGKKKEYQEASKFFSRLKHVISEGFHKDVKFVFVPGVNSQRKWATSGTKGNGHLELAPAPPKK